MIFKNSVENNNNPQGRILVFHSAWCVLRQTQRPWQIKMEISFAVTSTFNARKMLKILHQTGLERRTQAEKG